MEPEGSSVPALPIHLRETSALIAAGQVDEALSQLRELVRRTPTATPAYLQMATLLRETQRPAEARQVLETAVTHAPACPFSWEALAEVCLEAGCWDDAIRYCKTLLELRPRSLQARSLLAVAYLHQGAFEKALRITEEVIRLDPADPIGHYQRGVLQQQGGQTPAAVSSYRRALELSPDEDTRQACAAALDELDRAQVRQILTIAAEDVLFRCQLKRAPRESIAGRGFALSERALLALRQALETALPTPQPGWRHYNYH